MNEINKNIDGLFQDSFANYEVKPSSKVWYKVQQGVLPAKISYIYKKSFTGYQQAPGSSIWSAVNARLAWYRFWFFNPYSINVYYLVAALTVAGSGLWLSGVFGSGKSKDETSQNLVTDRAASNDALRNAIPEILMNVQPGIIVPVVNNQFTASSQQKPVGQTTQNQIFVSVESVVAENNSENTTGNRNVEINQPANEVLTANSVNDGVENSTIPTESQKAITKMYLNKLQYPAFALRFNPDPDIWEKLALSQGLRPTPIVPDTLGYDYRGTPIIVAGQYISFEPNYSGFYTGGNIFSTRPEIRITDKSPIFSQNYSYAYNVHVALQSRHLRVLSGLGYSVNSESYQQISSESSIQTRFEYNTFEYQDWQRDTTWLLDLDAWLHGDTVYFPFVDSTLVNLTDSTVEIVYDTIFRKDTALYNNKYTYYEVPLIAGYSFHLKNWSITPQTGVVFGFLSSSAGSYPVSDELSYNMTNMYPMRQVLVSWYAGLNVRYYFMENLGLMAEPWFTRTLTPLYCDNVSLNRNQTRLGIRLGLSIRI